MADRPSTPPPALNAPTSKPALTPEQVRRIEENRLKAKAIRNQNERQTHNATLVSNAYHVGQKRPHAATTTSTTTDRTVRDARQTPGVSNGSHDADGPRKPHDDIIPARRTKKYIDYDFSVMKDTKGGFLSIDDDPHNRALHSNSRPNDPNAEQKPSHMTVQEWERHQLLKKLRAAKSGPFEPGVLQSSKNGEEGGGISNTCVECGSLEVDWLWAEIFSLLVCNACKDKVPEKYSLLTKSEAREDYLLTDPELKDPDLLPRLEKPNPHKASWHNMQLYLRCQVEAYAFSERKWGSEAGLDAEFARREKDKKKRKEDKFKGRLEDLKRKTRVEAFARRKAQGGGGRGGEFGEKIVGRGGEVHEHSWGGAVVTAEGMSVKRCTECDMEVEELEF